MITYQEILHDVGNDEIRGIYANQLPKGNPRRELIHAQLDVKKLLQLERDDWYKRQEDVNNILLKHLKVLMPQGLENVEKHNFIRGFTGYMKINAESYLKESHNICRSVPIEEISLTGYKQHMHQLFSSKYFRQFRAIILNGDGLEDKDIKMITESENLTELRSLCLSHNNLTMRGFEYLASAKNMPNLKQVFLQNNKDQNPNYHAIIDEMFGMVIDMVCPNEETRRLEKLGPNTGWLSNEPKAPYLLD